jgi:uncharacterized protein YacL
MLLFFSCWILVVVSWPEFYSSLSVLEKINLAAYFFIFVAIYMLPSPVWFWIISLIGYHIILVFFVKYLFTQKNPVKKVSRSQLKKKSKKNKNKAKTTKYKIL